MVDGKIVKYDWQNVSKWNGLLLEMLALGLEELVEHLAVGLGERCFVNQFRLAFTVLDFYQYFVGAKHLAQTVNFNAIFYWQVLFILQIELFHRQV